MKLFYSMLETEETGEMKALDLKNDIKAVLISSFCFFSLGPMRKIPFVVSPPPAKNEHDDEDATNSNQGHQRTKKGEKGN